MREMMPRREFLNILGVGALVAVELGVVSSLPAYAAPNQTSSLASKRPRLLTGCCAYSYNAQFKRSLMTLEDFILKAVELQVDGVDVTGYYLKSTEPAYLESLRHLAYRNAVMFSGAACGVSILQADAAGRAMVLPEIKKWVDVTSRLGAPHLRVFVGKLGPGESQQQAMDWIVETMKTATDYSARQGVTLGIENNQGLSQSADKCLEIMHRVDSPYAGINLDVTHFVPTQTQDAYAQIAACIPFATNTHIRDVFDDQTPINLDRVWPLFAQAGFRGFMSAEYEDKTPGGTAAASAVPELLEEIRALNKRYSSV